MMKKAVLQFTACCMAVGVSVAGFSSAVLADTNTNPSATLAGVDAAAEVPEEDAEADVEAVQPETVTTLAGASGAEAVQEVSADTGTSEVTGSYTFGFGVVTAQEEDDESEEETTAQTAGETIPETSASETQVVEPSESEDIDEEAKEEISEEASEEASEEVSEEETETEPETTLAGVTLAVNVDDESADEADEDADEDTASEKAEKAAEEDDSLNGSQAFALCEDYINVRSSANTDSEVIGKIYNYNEATILGKYGDWYKIQSGNVTGYVKAEYFAVGEDAELIAESVGYSEATVEADALMVRTAPDENAESIDMAYEAEELEVISDEGDWMKVILPNGTIGYVKAEYVDVTTYYSAGETLEEEQARLDAEWLAYLAEQEAAAAEAAAAEAAAQAAAQAVYYEPTYTTPTYVETSYVSSSSVDAAYQKYLDAQAAADAACQQADEQLVYDTYDAAVAAYQEYLNAVAAQDAAAAGSSYTYTEPTYTETYTETTTYVDSSSVDAAYQNYLDAQAAADAACLQADEQLVYDTYDVAVDAYQEYLNAVAAQDAAAAGSSYTYTEPTYTETTTYVDSSSVDAAYQKYLDAQAAADAACLQADEQLVYDTYDAAVAAYQEYLDACNGQASAVTETTTVYETVENTGYAETTYEETYVEETTVEPVAATTSSSSGSSIASFATQFVGNPYVYGGTSLTNGADCSGFTQSVFANFGISIPRTAAAQSTGGTAVSLSDIQPGDLLFYSDGSGISHVSMYIGNNQVVHASTSSTGIIISSVDYRTPVSARRYW